MAEKILIVDDDLDGLKLIGLLLQRQGYEVIAASSGSQGLAQAKETLPDLILLDLMMPDMDGYHVCRRLRESPDLAHIPIIMFTAKTQVDDKVAGFDAGADDYLTKPTHPAELASRIKALMERPRAAPPVSPVEETAEGKIIAVMGATGGAGVTTVAVNLSVALADMGKTLILADLQYGRGAIGLQLGRPQGAGLSRLLEQPLEALSRAGVERELLDYPPGMRLLLASYDPLISTIAVPGDHLARIVGHLGKLADTVVLDLGSTIGKATSSALAMADLILLCLSPQRASLIMAQKLVSYVQRTVPTSDQIAAVVVQLNPLQPAASANQIREQLSLPVLGSIPPSPELAHSAAAEERPIITLRPQSEIATEFYELAKHVASRL